MLTAILKIIEYNIDRAKSIAKKLRRFLRWRDENVAGKAADEYNEAKQAKERLNGTEVNGDS